MSKVVKSKSSKTNKKVIEENIPIIEEEKITKKRVIKKKPSNIIESNIIKSNIIKSNIIESNIIKSNKDNIDDNTFKQKKDIDEDINDKDDKNDESIETESIETEDIDDDEDEEKKDEDNEVEEDEKEDFDEEIIDKKMEYLEKEEEGEECIYDLEYDEIYDTELDKQAIEVSKEDRITKNIMTTYERVRVLGIRAKQITLGAKVLIKTDINISAMEKAVKELEAGMTPLKIKRTLPNNKYEIWKISELVQK